MSKNAKIVWWIIGIVVVVGLVWWGIAKNSGSANTIKIGWIGPLTGDLAAYGEGGQNVTQLAVSEINAAGGINGKQMQVIYEDGACDGTTGANAMQKLANVDGVQVVLGGFCSGESLAAVPIATQSKVALFSASATSPKLTGSSPYFFRDYPSDNSQGKVLADAAYNTKHWKTVALLQEQTDYAAGINGAFTQEFQNLGGKAISEQYLTDTSDFRSVLIKLKSQHPDALFIDANGTADAPRIFQQMQALGWKLPLLVNDSVADDTKFVSTNASALEGTLTAQFAPDQNNPTFQHLLAAYKTKYGTDLPYQNYGQTEYDAVYLLAAGIKQVGNNGTALAQWSRTIKDWQGASGMITIDANGDRVGGDVLQVIHSGTVQTASGT
jgi:branched-chain amino acid transport system substrate-binding protein